MAEVSKAGRVGKLAVAGSMAFLAGATDVYGLNRLGDLFVSFMGGNTTKFALAMGRGDWPRAGLVGGLLGIFFGGAVLGAVLGVLGGRRHAGLVALVSALLLSVPLIRPGWTIPAFLLAMGALNGAITRIGDATVGLTYVTGTVVRFGQGVGQALCGQPGDWSWAWQLPMWLSLVGGAVAATLVREWLGTDVLWPVAALAGVVAVAAMLRDAIAK